MDRMKVKAREIMTTDVHVVSPNVSLIDLERMFIRKSVGGFPVVEDGKLVGIVSRSDVVRTICVEQSISETITYLYRVNTDQGQDSAVDAKEVAERVAERLKHFEVKNVMITNVLSASPDDSLTDIARLLLKHHIHRLPITDDGKLLGIISTLDLTRLFAEERVRLV